MKPLSLILCTIGIIGIFFALSMDTSVATYGGDRIHNIGLISDRQNYVIASGILLLVGVILFGFSTISIRSTPNQQRASFKNVLHGLAAYQLIGVCLGFGTCRLLAYNLVISGWGFRYMDLDRLWLTPTYVHLWVIDFPVSLVYMYLFDLPAHIGEAYIGPIWWTFLPYFIWKLHSTRKLTLVAGWSLIVLALPIPLLIVWALLTKGILPQLEGYVATLPSLPLFFTGKWLIRKRPLQKRAVDITV